MNSKAWTWIGHQHGDRVEEREGGEDDRVDGKEQRGNECEGGIETKGGIIISVIH